jgi:hypothetical protein
MRRARGLVLLILAWGLGHAAGASPAPAYDISLRLDTAQASAEVCERVRWTNPGPAPVSELVFNAHAHYQLPAGENLALAKMLELVRVSPEEGLPTGGPALSLGKVELRHGSHGEVLAAYFRSDQTTLVVALPRPLRPGEQACVDLHFGLRLPHKQGRWGQWRGITYLSGCLPVLALHDESGWHPTPFLPWHQAACHEAGRYRLRVRLPDGQVLACTARARSVHDLGDGWQEIDTEPVLARDFALVASEHFKELTLQAGPVSLRCLCLPEHAEAGVRMLQAARQALFAYAEWFGPYPYPEFTIVETYLGWNARACAGLAMIDARVFALPAFAAGYGEYVIAQQLAQQWWYNLVGTDGYNEPYLDAGFSVYCADRLLDRLHGRNSSFMSYPRGLGWLPQVRREDFHASVLQEQLARGDEGPAAQELPHFEDPARWSALAAERGSKVFGMIEARLGEDGFLQFARDLVEHNRFGIVRTADLQNELEALSHQPWDGFFRDWVQGAGQTDWCIEKVKVRPATDTADPEPPTSRPGKGYRVVVRLRQKGEIDEPTCLGVRCEGEHDYPTRVPIDPALGVSEFTGPRARVEALSKGRVLVELWLPRKPEQITVDPDGVLLDRDPANNTWKPEICWHFTPLYTFLDESDLSCAHDRWNLICGPWVLDPTWDDPWFMRAAVVGVRLGAVRSQQFQGGIYTGWRPDYRDFAYGADLALLNFPVPKMEVGLNVERSLFRFREGGTGLDRAAVYCRYVLDESSSFVLPPTQYVEGFAANQNHYLPHPRYQDPEAERFDTLSTLGVHYHLDLLTPYWDPDRGFRIDSTLAGGLPVLGEKHDALLGSSQLSFVQTPSESFGWLSQTRFAFRLYGAAALPEQGQFFSLGGDAMFRGFDMRERQGSAVWVGSVEWRVPLLHDCQLGCCDHAVGLKQVLLTPFYDAGSACLGRHTVGGVAHALGMGLRFDVGWVSFLERTILRVDVAKTVNEDTPVQLWLGIQHPF